ncbi:hypothetical protein PUNSTDRAFT_138176 [Punctularia strigosozonata HHB-11173 SS5]|uniref:Uncharacterized protein n=1 Tax=Punctularia strigosozonata (strain HHB-11173) TaxID=741275 RepID=R7S3K7_PUNST|nr:uncharacterized protein PUNSTDRAFT_138176 [Punctularia strigosozonata HHB-11173 SS5]EIN04990.1 hypothetical protein PUNSTDRAFT_138176 [Punctularia strigosozonata HHB-11173 SS5]
MQNRRSLIYRKEERGMFPVLKHLRVGIFSRSPLARALVARPLNEETKRKEVYPGMTP